jgi:hypothetical protein
VASIADVAPALLAAHGLEPLPRMEGSMRLWVVDSDEGLSSLKAGTEPGSTDEELISSHLRRLGHVD